MADDMSAEVLREAARLMRERAEAATPGPWTQGMAGTKLLPEVDNAFHFGMVVLTALGTDDGDGGVSTATHIASWPPGVALAVADWLDEIAAKEAARGLAGVSTRVLYVDRALAVARAYLGETS